MVRLVRHVRLPSVGASRRFAGLRQPGFRAYAMEVQRIVYDAGALGSSRSTVASFKNDLTLVLAGTWIDRRDGEHRLHAGQARWGPTARSLSDRWEDDARLLTLEWDEPVVTAHEERDFSGPVQSAAERYVSAVTEATRDEAVPPLLELIDELRAAGFPVPQVTPEIPPPEAVRAAEMLNQALMHLDEVPMWVDFTNGRSERQWRRDLTRAAPWIGLLEGSFRATLNTIRVHYATGLLGVPGVERDEVARALGYGSGRALMTALRRLNVAL